MRYYCLSFRCPGFTDSFIHGVDMPTADFFPDLFEPFSTTAHFSEATIKAVEKTLSEKSGKPYLKCLIRGKEVMAKP